MYLVHGKLVRESGKDFAFTLADDDNRASGNQQISTDKYRGCAGFVVGLTFAFKSKCKPEIQTINIHHHDSTKVIEPVKDGLTPKQIASTNTSKVVFIEFGCKLIHTFTGDDIYHKYMPD